MGFLSAGGDSRANDLAEEEFRRNQIELEEKKHNLYKTRLDIMKGQGAQSWTPDMGTPQPDFSKNPFHKKGFF